MSDLTIKMRDIRAARLCSRGTRKFFERHNLDWADFLKNGISAEKLEATEDAMALKVVEIAHGRK